MTSIEKTIVAIVVASAVVLVVSLIDLNESLEKAGGFKSVIIELGKEIKDIDSEIAKYKPKEEEL